MQGPNKTNPETKRRYAFSLASDTKLMLNNPVF